MTTTSGTPSASPAADRQPRWRSIRARWADYRWFVIGGLWLAALLLGAVGFARHLTARGESPSLSTVLYLTLQLFTLESGAVSGPIGWPLEVARWLAPAVAAYTALQTLALIFREQLQLARLRFFNDHTVICGLGRKGLSLVRGFRQRGDRVVVIERNEDNDFIEAARAEGAVVLSGDATRPEMLRRARVHTARRLISVCGDDGINAEAGVQSVGLVAGDARAPLECILHITNPHLCDLLREREIESGRIDGFRLQFFNVFEASAQALLNEYVPLEGPFDRPPHILLVGFGNLGESLLLQMARRWSVSRPAAASPLRVTVVDRDADHRTESLCRRYPRLTEACQLVPQAIDVSGPALQGTDFLLDPDGEHDLTAAIVSLDDDSLALSTALTLRQELLGQDVPIIVRVEQAAGLARLIEGMHPADDSYANLHAFALLDRTCVPDRLLAGTHEIIARAVHEGYLGSQVGTSPTAVAWEQLSEEYRESCRRQADHIGDKLRAAGCVLAALTDWNEPPLQFRPDEVEIMARMEHERWMAQRLRDGWTFGPRDEGARTNPNLVPWDDLPEDVKELNRDMVRALPESLARVGLRVVRTDHPEPSA